MLKSMREVRMEEQIEAARVWNETLQVEECVSEGELSRKNHWS